MNKKRSYLSVAVILKRESDKIRKINSRPAIK